MRVISGLSAPFTATAEIDKQHKTQLQTLTKMKNIEGNERCFS